MNIGEPLRTIIVEPLELPVNAPAVEPEPEPVAHWKQPATTSTRRRKCIANVASTHSKLPNN